jgi:alanine racemase
MAMTFEPVNHVEIDLASIAHNAREIRRLVGPSCLIVAALKSNAHGFGLIEVATTVLASGAGAVAVVNLADAVQLRQAGVTSPILLYGGVVADEQTSAILADLELMPTILDHPSARIYSAHVTRPISYMVKVDVGLQRLGLDPNEVVPFLQAVTGLPRLHFRGLYTHMHALSGPEGDAYLDWQFQRFAKVIAALDEIGLAVPIRLAASSSVLTLSSAMNLNAVDPGRLFYGLFPTSRSLREATFRSAFVSLRSRLVQVKQLVRSGYPEFAPFLVRPGMRIGVFPLGRSDGLETLSVEHVLVRGRHAPILVRPSLEHTRVDLSDVSDAEVGDEVVIIGRQGSAEIKPEDVTERLKMDPGELAVGIRGSIARRYLRST